MVACDAKCMSGLARCQHESRASISHECSAARGRHSPFSLLSMVFCCIRCATSGPAGTSAKGACTDTCPAYYCSCQVSWLVLDWCLRLVQEMKTQAAIVFHGGVYL